MRKIFKKLVILSTMFVLLLTGCSTTNKNIQLAEKVKENIPALNDMTTGAVDIDSITSYYTDIEGKWTEIIAAKPPKEYLAGIEAQESIAIIMKTLTTDLKSEKTTVEVVYIGKIDTNNTQNVSGIFIYNFEGSDLSSLTDQMIKDANSFTDASETGEYFHKNGNYIITCEYGLVDNPEETFGLIDQQITTLS